MKKETIETPRLFLRRFTRRDGEALYGYLGNAEAVRFEPYNVFTLAECRREAALRARSDVYWAACLKSTGTLIGNVSLVRQHYSGWELGYIFNPAYHGNGYATEAARAMVGRAFTVWGAHRVSAMCNPQNTPSSRLLERLGMRREGHMLQNVCFKVDETGRALWQDSYLYAILRNEWADGQ